MLLIWPFEGIAIVVGAILLLTLGEMLLAPISSALAVSLAPVHLRGSYEAPPARQETFARRLRKSARALPAHAPREAAYPIPSKAKLLLGPSPSKGSLG
jgi:hypothetical protein